MSWLARLRQFALLPNPPKPRPEAQRWYVWRTASGTNYVRLLAPDACHAWLASYAIPIVEKGAATAPGAAPSPNTLFLYVEATGERLSLDGEPGVRAQLLGPEDAGAFVKFDRRTAAVVADYRAHRTNIFEG